MINLISRSCGYCTWHFSFWQATWNSL